MKTILVLGITHLLWEPSFMSLGYLQQIERNLIVYSQDYNKSSYV